MMDYISELYTEIAMWIDPQLTSDTPLGIWKGETPEWTVEVNRGPDEVDGLPFAFMRLSHKTYIGFAALNPFGGAVTGTTEDALIRHFRDLRRAA